MAEKTVTIHIDTAGGRLAVEGSLFLGETADIVFDGVSASPKFIVFDDDGVTNLADNATDAAVLDLRYDALRTAFGDNRAVKTFRAMAIVNGDGEDVYAKGTVSIKWSPVVFDPITGAPATLVGPQGETGTSPHIGENGNWFVGTTDTGVAAQGPQGDPASVVQVIDPDTGKWHYVYARKNADGEFVLSMDQSASDVSYSGKIIVTDTEPETPETDAIYFITES